jgi:dephospho-CoA kinase
MTVKIALTGHARSGKSLLAGYAALFYDYHPFAFGDELKRMAHAAYPWIPREPKPRRLYQEFGQALRGLNVDNAENVWIEHVLKAVTEHEKYCRFEGRQARVMVTDLRQPNEFSRLKAEGYTIIRVTAPLETRLERARQAGDAFEAKDFEHDTERHIDGFAVDYEIVNDSELTDLYAKFDAIMRDLHVEKAEGMG